MSKIQINTTISTNASNFQEVNVELSKLKATIGMIISKLPSDQRRAFIADLKTVGFNDAVEIYNNFIPEEDRG
ncbi:hypothetical protein PUG42_19720 [Erwiniaceae bacterium L1_54_3]|nr:hypothetical protein [Erwiniaceae bacterium L1_54_3]